MLKKLTQFFTTTSRKQRWNLQQKKKVKKENALKRNGIAQDNLYENNN